MIVKQVASKGKGSFQALAAYLLYLKSSVEKVETNNFFNCPLDLVEENT